MVARQFLVFGTERVIVEVGCVCPETPGDNGEGANDHNGDGYDDHTEAVSSGPSLHFLHFGPGQAIVLGYLRTYFCGDFFEESIEIF